MDNPFTDKQWEFLRADYNRINLLVGSVRSGKTYILHYLVSYLVEQAKGNKAPGFLIAKTLETLRDNVLLPMKQIYGDSMQFTNHGKDILLSGFRLRGFGANDERAIAKIWGSEASFVVGDEVTEWPQNFFNALLSRMSARNAKLFGSCNPDSPFHWLKRDVIDRKQMRAKTFKFLIDDNTFLDKDYVTAIKREYAGTVWYSRYILSEWALAEGLVYDIYQDCVIGSKEFEKIQGVLRGYDSLIGVDVGTTNPMAFTHIKTNYKNYVLTDEFYYDSQKARKQLSDYEYGNLFDEWIKELPITNDLIGIYVDPSAASFIQELRNRGYTVFKANNDKLPGIRALANLMAVGNFLVCSTCKNWIGEASSYVWDVDASLRTGKDTPKKENDHLMDATRYPIYSFMRANRQY